MNLTTFEITAVVTSILVAVLITMILYSKEKKRISDYMESLEEGDLEMKKHREEMDEIESKWDQHFKNLEDYARESEVRNSGIRQSLLSQFPLGKEIDFLETKMVVTGVRSVNMNYLPSLITDYVGNDGQIRQYAFSEDLLQACFDYRPFVYEKPNTADR